MASLVVPHRFRGPARSGNGGWTAGSYAELLAPGTVEVTLKQPPPLDTPIEVTVADGTASSDIADARLVDRELVTVAPVSAGAARAAEASYAGWGSHPFPSCFSCGTSREDGLRIFPGEVASDPRRVAATWTPSEVTVPITWAALDCVGAWSDDLEDRPMVLGRITATIHVLPAVGAEHVLVGQRVDVQGRKTLTAATLYDDGGRAIARAEHVWIVVDPAVFNDLRETP
jgi:predicted thioesterase